MLNKNFNFEYRNFVNSLLGEIKSIKLSKDRDEDFEKLVQILKLNSISEFMVFDDSGLILHKIPSVQGAAPEMVNAEIRRKSIELSIETSVFRTPYKLIPNSEDFTVDFFMPIVSSDGSRVFLYTLLRIDQIKERLMGLYWQIGLSVMWGIIFHLVFGIFVYRVIFRRVLKLTSASDKMESGDLTSRVDWKFERGDELDELGISFNRMAGRIEGTIEKISQLNSEIQNELEIGKDVQQLFLPTNEIFKEFNVEVHYRPMREVSGDIYNFYLPGNDYRALFFADASGHGVSAALITAITLMSLDVVLKKTIQPNRVIEKLNVLLADRLQSSFFATGIFMVFSPDGKCHFSSAGHNPVIYARPSTGKIELLDKSGPPLGMFDEVEYTGQMLLTAPGDKILVYSDALVESKNSEGEMYSLERVMELFMNNIHLPNAELLDLIRSSIDQFTLEFTDDLSMILLEIPG